MDNLIIKDGLAVDMIDMFDVIDIIDVTWYGISERHKLSEKSIEKHKYKVNWGCISKYQKLSEEFIEKYEDRVDFDLISKYQKLSEEFIEKYKDRVDWYRISKYQKLSEEFIEKHNDKVFWHYILKYQKLSEKFIEKHNLKTPNNWLYEDTEFKKQKVIDTNLYECYDDYFIAYKGIRKDRYSKFNFQYQYLQGNTYECHADYTSEENSFGLSVWTKNKAEEHCNELVIKAKIKYEDVARVVYNGGKIRCCKFEVLN